MNFISNLDILLKENGITSGKMLKDLNMGVNQYTYWKKSNTYPTKKNLQKIAEYFNVPIEYFYSDQKEKPAVSGELTPKQQEIIDLISDLPDQEYEKALSYLKFLVNAQDKK